MCEPRVARDSWQQPWPSVPALLGSQQGAHAYSTQTAAQPEFLRACAFPCSLLREQRNPNATFTKTVRGLPYQAQKLVYWATDPPVYGAPLEESPLAAKAYAAQINVGVAAVNNGQATLHLECPQRTQTRPLYLDKGSLGDALHKQVHYRTCEGGYLGPIYTVDLSRECGYD